MDFHLNQPTSRFPSPATDTRAHTSATHRRVLGFSPYTSHLLNTHSSLIEFIETVKSSSSLACALILFPPPLPKSELS